MSAVTHVWSQIWPNLLASAITFATGSIWHLALIRRTMRHHENVLKQHLTAHRRSLTLTDLEDESDSQRD